jgi:hypothetical protein
MVPVVGLEPTSLDSIGFKDRRVYQFHHTGASKDVLIRYGIKGNGHLPG